MNIKYLWFNKIVTKKAFYHLQWKINKILTLIKNLF